MLELTVSNQLFPSSVYKSHTVRLLNSDNFSRAKRLWLAVLQRALQDYMACLENDVMDDELYQWFHSPSYDYIGDFRCICNTLEIDADRLLSKIADISRDGLRSLRKTGLLDVY